MADDLRFDVRDFLRHRLYDLELVYSKGFNYGAIYFYEFIENITNTYVPEYPFKCPFIYYSRELLILKKLRSYFKHIIGEERSLDSKDLESVVDHVIQRLDRLDLNHLDFQSGERVLNSEVKKNL